MNCVFPFVWHWVERKGDDFRGATATPQERIGESGHVMQMQDGVGGSVGVRWGGPEIFGRFTTSVVCRGIERESLVWHVRGRIYFCGGEAHGTCRKPLSLSAHFFSPSALGFCLLGASPGRQLLPQELPLISGVSLHAHVLRKKNRRLVYVPHFLPAFSSFPPFPVLVPKTVLRAAYTLPFLLYLIFLVTWKVWFGLLGV